MAASRRGAPRTRHVYPLKLWPDKPNRPDATHTLQKIDGALHLVPPLADRPMLAWAWLYDQATRPHEVPPPTVAQLRHLPAIAAMAHAPTPTNEPGAGTDWCALLDKAIEEL